MEDYKKKYEQALEIAKNIYNDDLNSGTARAVCEQIFLELKESDDEKIRKQLLNWFKDCHWDSIDDGKLKRDDIIAWLEKQGKNEEINEASYRTGIKRVLDNPESYGLEKQGEQKPAWSEEDEMMIEDIIEAIDTQYAVSDYNDMVSWLKSLKERVQPIVDWKHENTGDLTDFENAMMHIGESFFGKNSGLNPNDTNTIKEQANILSELVQRKEWSEEDYAILGLIQDAVDKFGFDSIKTYYTVSDWIKSLRPQHHYKPNVEQMKSLFSASSGPVKGINDNLRSLYEDLKKLM